MPCLAKDRIDANGKRSLQGPSATKAAYWKALRSVYLPFVLVATIMMTSASAARATSYTVNATDDTSGAGNCSLRDAINAANGTPTSTSTCTTPGTGTDTIQFSVTGTITLNSALPVIANTSPGSLTIDGSGQAITLDGATEYQIFSVNSGATLKLQFLTLFHGSVTDGEGGAIINQGTLTVTNSTFSANQAAGGGGGHHGDGDGGAISNQGTLTVTNSTFSANQANGGSGGPDSNGDGGAIFNANASTLTVTNSTFSANQAAGDTGGFGDKGDGGAIFNAGTLTVTNNTFSANKVDPGSGGGGVNGEGGAIFNESSGTVELKGTILAASTPTPGNCGGSAVTDAGYNISDDATCNFVSGSGSSVITLPSVIGLDPFGLQNNGGPTQTIALLAGSPAIDAIPLASCTLTTDQRGMPRPDAGEGVCDIGAYEFQESFAGTSGTTNCQGKSVSALSQQYGSLAAAANALGFPSVKALQAAIKAFCAG